MKKKFMFIIILLFTFVLSGCQSVVVNEIYNKTYNSEINIKEFEDLIVAAVEKTSPAVLGVSSYTTEGILVGDTLVGTGSGVVYDCKAEMKDGTIVDDCKTTMESDQVKQYNYLMVTNRHVVDSKEHTIKKIKVYDGDADKLLPATLIQFDDKVDIAVVAFSYSKFISPAVFADSDKIKKGSFAVAIGNPAGYEYYGSATFGIISYPKRYMSDDTDGDNINDWDAEYIQHDVAINPGNSGGALINIKGEIIGINTLKLVKEEIDNMGFAIPSNVVRDLVKILQTGNKPKRYKLGISVYTVKDIINSDYPFLDKDKNPIKIPEEIKNGIFVSEVDANGIGAGFLKPGDIIVGFNGNEIDYSYQFRAYLGQIVKGDTVLFKVFRNNQFIDVNIQFT